MKKKAPLYLTNQSKKHHKNTKYSGMIWNAIGGMINAGQSAIILIFVSYKLGHYIAGMVTIAYAIANLLSSICKYGVRNFQVTDANEEFHFTDYFYNRCFTTFITLMILSLYIGCQFLVNDYSWSKGLILIEVTLLKLIDAFEDVYIGRFQQNGRLDIGARVMSLRLLFSTLIICALIVLGTNINIALLGGMFFSIIIDIFLLSGNSHIVDVRMGEFDINKIGKLMRICFPLCMGMTLSIYIGNVPKYMLDVYMNDEKTQAIFGYIMMPVFVIMLLSQFIYQPMIKDLGDLWNTGKKTAFKRNVIRQCFIIFALSCVVIITGLFLGLPILSLLYNVDLSSYQMEFFVLLLGGGGFALASYLNVPITIIRRQKFIAFGYLIASILSIILGKFLVGNIGMMGAAILYLMVNVFLAISYCIVLGVGVTMDGK